MRENASSKADRLLTCGRLTVEWIDASTIRATVRGDSAEVYRVGFQPGRGWSCTCAAFTRCSHVLALQRVALVPAPRRWAEAAT
jgi:hypothetical protein